MASIKKARKAYTRADFGSKDLKRVVKLAECGMTDEMIADAEGVSEATLKNHCAKELAKGRARGNGKLAGTLFSIATSGDCPAATIFCAKVRLKWREADREDVPVHATKSPKGLAIG